MKNRCAIISGGDYSDLTRIREADFVIACDKGYAYASRNGVTPDLVIGDFDSFREKVDDSLRVVRLPVEKDDTDTLAAIRYAVREGYREIALYCAMGGRRDHEFANCQACAFAASRGVNVTVFEGERLIRVLAPGKYVFEKKEQDYLSVFSLSDVSRGVSISGAKYGLEKTDLSNLFPVGVSNEWISDVEISFSEGILMVIREKKD